MKKPDELWKPMLAAKPDPAELDAVLAKLPLPALFSPKLDGIRATVQNGKLYSRSLKLIPNKAMQALWGRKELNGLDGEVVVGPPTAEDCFNHTSSVVMSRDKGAEDAVFYVFDRYSVLLHPFKFRYDSVVGVCSARTFCEKIQLVKHKHVASPKKLAEYEAQVLKAGYEGIMRRDPAGKYKQGRSTVKEGGLIAIKRFVDAEAVILDTYEQMENTNEKKVNELGKMKRSSHKAGKVGKGTLGGFVVRTYGLGTYGGTPPGETFNIGTGQGLTDAVRLELWNRRKSLIGKIVKFRYQLIGTKDAPRQPIFLGFRDKGDM